jgi:hypothetical protein
MFSNDQMDTAGDEGRFRIATAVSAVVPIALIFLSARKWNKASQSSAIINGAPKPQFFQNIWVFVGLLWAWVTVVCAFFADQDALIGFFVIHVFTALCAAYWPYANQVKGTSAGIKSMGVLLFALVLMFAYLLLLPMTNLPEKIKPEDAKKLSNQASMAAVLPWTPVLGWGAYATVLAFVDGNLN